MAFKKISHDGVIYDVDIQGGGGTGAVNSVNGKQGDVVLTGADIKTNTGATVNAAIAGKQNMLTAEEKQAIADMHQDAVTSVNGQTGAVTVPASEPYDDTEIRDEIAGLNRDLINLDGRKMEYKILTFDGTAFALDGQTLTFSEIKSLCLNTADFVYALYENRLYIPQYISNTNIFFDASYIQSDIPKMHRISINSSNQVSQFNFDLAKASQIPTALPTPNALTFTGASTGTFDGSAPLSINIPTGGPTKTTELILEITTETDLAYFSTKLDGDGNQLSLVACSIVVDCPIGTTTSGCSFCFFEKDTIDGISNYQDLYHKEVFINNGVRNNYRVINNCICAITNGLWVMQCCNNIVNANGIPGGSFENYQIRNRSIDDMKIVDGIIGAFRINVPMPAGTKILVYGQRA